MSKFKPTDEQEKVLSFKGKNMIVSASAGSGKTATLVEFISQLVKSGQPIKRILLLTFTRAASFEMKERLLANFYEEATDDNILDAIDDVPTADISTIHAFLGNLIRRNTNILPISDGFVVFNEEELCSLKEKAFALAEKEFKERNQKQYEELFLRLHNNRKFIFSLLENMLSFFATIENSHEKIEQWKASREERYAFVIKSIENLFLPKIEKIKQNISMLKIRLDDEKYTLYINSLESILSQKEPFKMFKAIANSIVKAPTTSKKVDPLALENLKVEYRAFKEIKEELLSINIDDERIYDENEFGKLENQFYDFYLIYEKNLAEQKEKLNGVDFNDLESFAKQLLESEEIKNQIQSDYDYIFIDEYQDTNYVQASIVKEIAKASHFIAVGDPKQGIYGFRNATSEIIKNDIKNFEAEQNSSAEFLRKNFRSDPHILNFVNNVFVGVMKDETVGIDYEKTSMLKAGKEDQVFDKDLPAVRLDIIKKEEGEKEEKTDDVYDIMKDDTFKKSSKSLEAKVIALRVQEIMLRQIYDAKEDKMRNATYRDIAILTRGKSELAEEIIKELSAKKIPVVSEIRGNFKDYAEILAIINLFKLLLDFRDDTSLLSVMLSKIGGFSVDEVARLRINASEKEFYEIVKNSTEEKVIAFKKQLENLRFKLEVKGAYIMLEDLFKEIDFRPYLSTKENAENYLFVLDKFLEQIKNSGVEFDLPSLVAFLNQDEIDFKGGGRNSNAVSICTIHSSKGLEYPVVILADTGKNMLETSREQYVLDNDFGLALNYFSQEEDNVYLTPMVYLLKNKAKVKAQSDEIMLLYVALTRAQRHLYITGTLKENALEKLSEEPMQAKSYLEMMLSSYKKLILPNKKEELDRERVEVNEIDGVEDIFAIKDKFVGSADDEVVKKIEEYFDFVYPHKKATQTIYKNSVSAINEVRKVANGGNVLGVEEEFIEKGNAYHLALKEIDFSSVNSIEDVKAELEKIADEGVKKYVDENLLYKNIEVLKKVLSPCDKIFKEQQFTSIANLKEVLGEGEDEEIMLQGIVDLFAFGEKNILIDYKFTSITGEELLKKKYEKQLLLYKNAIENAYNLKINEVYLLSIKNNFLIKF